MPHIPKTDYHRVMGDPLLVVIPVADLLAVNTSDATWRCEGIAGVEKTIGAGITVIDGAAAKVAYPGVPELVGFNDAGAVLQVDVDPIDIELDIGIGRWRWQAQTGGIEPQTVGYGHFAVSRRVDAPGT